MPTDTDGPLEALNAPLLVYLNPLSDTLFILARLVNVCVGVPEQRPTYRGQLIAAGLGYRYTADR